MREVIDAGKGGIKTIVHSVIALDYFDFGTASVRVIVRYNGKREKVTTKYIEIETVVGAPITHKNRRTNYRKYKAC